MKIKINEKLPDCEVFQLINEEPVKIKISSLFSNKKIINLANKVEKQSNIYKSFYQKQLKHN